MRFADLRLAEPIVRSVVTEGYTIPTPIQVQAIPHVLAGRDLLGCAQTGTGKTAAFALPILHNLIKTPHAHSRKIRVLVLTPTRELAAQIGESFRTYGRHTGLRHAVIFGGVGQGPQVSSLRSGIDILVATPGRLMDLMEQGHVHLQSVEVFVLDEADRMLDMGFIHDIRRIVPHLPQRRQTLMFSATMPAEIQRLAETILRNAAEVRVAAEAAAADTVVQSVYHVAKGDKPALLQHLLMKNGMPRTLVFTRTKHGADKVVKKLRAAGVRAEAIHGNKTQGARQRAMSSFKSQKPPVLVATDIASRGIDIDDISHVINYDIPHEAETYVHRIGRTGRAGASGIALSFCDPEERTDLRAIERLIRKPIPVCKDHPQNLRPAAEPVAAAATAQHSAVGFHPHHPRGSGGHLPKSAPAQHAPRHESGTAVATKPASGGGRGGMGHRGRPGRGAGAKHHGHPLGGRKHRRF
jgi:ATP-dependent RNA helicase RhlE